MWLPISQVTVRGMSMTNSILVHCFRNNIGLPELTQTFFCACFHSFRSDYNLRNPKLASIIETVTAAEYASFPDITAGFEGCEGCRSVYVCVPWGNGCERRLKRRGAIPPL
jgi:hypothetical protein